MPCTEEWILCLVENLLKKAHIKFCKSNGFEDHENSFSYVVILNAVMTDYIVSIETSFLYAAAV